MWIVFIFMWIIISFFLMFPYCDFLEKKEFIDVADEVSIYFFYDILSRLTLLGENFLLCVHDIGIAYVDCMYCCGLGRGKEDSDYFQEGVQM